MHRIHWLVPAVLLACLAFATAPAPRTPQTQPHPPRRGPRPGDPNYALFLRNGCAAGIEGLWVTGRLDTAQMVAELDKLLAEGPCPKAAQVLQRLAQSGRAE
jgi:hypothetical protein